MPSRRRTAREVLATTGIAMWYWYSLDQYHAASFFSIKCAREEANPRPPMVIDEIEFPIDPGQQIEHRSYVIAAILSSVAFLEAALNELLASASDDDFELAGGRGPLTKQERQALCDVRDQLRPPFLGKFQRVLRLLGRQPFNQGAQPYQDADLLVKLRNILVHSRPGWSPADARDQIAQDELLERLASKNFPLHPFAEKDDPFFPDKCLGAACADWAERTARAFADDFFGRLGITPAYAMQSRRKRRARILGS
jgi:hypothetical protein